jgi:hypothetical protein
MFIFWDAHSWFGLLVHPLSHTCNIGHINYSLQFAYYNTTYNIRTPTQYNIINNNTIFKSQLKVESITSSRYVCIYINIFKSSEFLLTSDSAMYFNWSIGTCCSIMCYWHIYILCLCRKSTMVVLQTFGWKLWFVAQSDVHQMSVQQWWLSSTIYKV